MNLSTAQISSFQALYKKRFGKEISDEEAYLQGMKLLTLMRLAYKPITKNDHEKYPKKI